MNSQNSNPIHYLTASDLYNINSEVTNGLTFVRDLHLLNSAAARPAIRLYGEAQFPSLVDKAAALLHSLAYHHLFVDGNKRTAVRAVVVFLEANGHTVNWADNMQAFLLEVAQGKHEVETVAAWLESQICPLSPKNQ